jgi:hypothetical protein
MVSISCGECGIAFSMPRERQRQLKESHETFYCPNGHHRWYPGKTEQERRIESLEHFNGQLIERRDEAYAECQDALGALKACPLRCGWRSRKQARRWDGQEAWERGLFRIQADVIDHLCDHHDLALPAEAENWLAEVAR